MLYCLSVFILADSWSTQRLQHHKNNTWYYWKRTTRGKVVLAIFRTSPIVKISPPIYQTVALWITHLSSCAWFTWRHSWLRRWRNKFTRLVRFRIGINEIRERRLPVKTSDCCVLWNLSPIQYADSIGFSAICCIPIIM